MQSSGGGRRYDLPLHGTAPGPQPPRGNRRCGSSESNGSTWPRCARIAGQLCDALAYAHQEGVAHLDVKPENIWVEEDESVKLMDFGIARLLTPGRMATTRMAMGTAYYMAPEQLKAGKVDGRADQFALAVVLYELLTGEVPQGAVQAPHELRKSVPEPLSKAIMKALSGPPEKRFADLAEFKQALESNRVPGRDG